MALSEVLMPQMGESVMEGTILSWLKKEGEEIDEEEPLLEVATDKVDTDIPSPFKGKIKQLIAKEGDVVQVGTPIAIIETEGVEQSKKEESTPEPEQKKEALEEEAQDEPVKEAEKDQELETSINQDYGLLKTPEKGRFYSPLVMNMAREEGISMQTLEFIPGSGRENRVTKKDLKAYIDAGKPLPGAKKGSSSEQKEAKPEKMDAPEISAPPSGVKAIENKEAPNVQAKTTTSYSGQHDIIEMDRMRKMIAQRMLDSKKISPHVTSFVEADVSNIVIWRNRNKQAFKEKENVALTFTPIFIEAVIKAIKDYPMINVSVEEDKIIVKKDINVGMAVALPNGNLVVPVIKNADQLNIVGLTKQVNDLARRARHNKLSADDLSGGTFTISNVGSFGNLMGTPIIVQPQVAILALGAVVKKPAVIETPFGDSIGIRHMMFLSHSYDHRVVDGSLGGMFVRRVADYLEAFDMNRKVFS